jgi:FK506-binding protein 1
MTTIELQPGITKKIIKEGEGGQLPETGEQITVHYTGKLEDGTVFDSSVTRGQPFECQIGVGQVIKGWDVGMMSMSIGEKAELTIIGEYAYGASGSPPTIPPNATLVFEVELLKIADREPVGMTDDELNKAAMAMKVKATEEFKAG